MICEIENLFNRKIGTFTSINRNTVKWVCSDDGDEYVGHEFQNWIRLRGIVHEIITAHFSESNGLAKRLNKSILHMSRAMVHILTRTVKICA